jgi:hypothetical protein
MTGMKTGVDTFDLEHIDIRREVVVQPVQDFLQREGSGCFKMSNLPQGMNPGIRSARALNVHGLTENLLRRPNQRALNAPRIFLGLPAAVAGTIILERQLISGHLNINTFDH